MKQIRRKVFETNSSSSHSLVYSKKDRGYNYDLPVDKDGVLTIPFGEFRWGPEILTTPMQKLSYYITDNFSGQGIDVQEVYDTKEAKYLISIIKKNCPQVKEVRFKESEEDIDFGYVDHQSVGTSTGERDLEKLIFSNSIIILIDNDNSDHYGRYFEYDSNDDRVQLPSVENLFK